MKILVIQQKMIGDVLTSSILFEALREMYPEAELHYLINTPTLPVVENNPFIDKVVLYTEDNKNAKHFLGFLKKIKKENYDVVIDVYAKLGSAMITAASAAKMRISYEKWYTRFCYTHFAERWWSMPLGAGLAIENRIRLLQPLERDFKPDLKPKIYLTHEELASAGRRIETLERPEKAPLFMISVLGSSLEKTYPLNYLAALLDEIVSETGAHLLFNYIPVQKEDAVAVYNHCRPETRKHIYLELFGKSLREFLAITAHCDALIGNEGGAVNMAKALDVPTFAIFSPQIEKQVWSLFTTDLNVGVHVNDHYSKYETKNLSSGQAYQKFKPEFILPKLKTFLKNISPQE